eukprot:15573-Heterococcus_DN1.PRE.3
MTYDERADSTGVAQALPFCLKQKGSVQRASTAQAVMLLTPVARLCTTRSPTQQSNATQDAPDVLSGTATATATTASQLVSLVIAAVVLLLLLLCLLTAATLRSQVLRENIHMVCTRGFELDAAQYVHRSVAL